MRDQNLPLRLIHEKPTPARTTVHRPADPLTAIAASISGWSARRIAAAEASLLEAEQRVVQARGALAEQMLRTELSERRLRLQRLVAMLPLEVARQLLQREIEIERTWLALEELQQWRLSGRSIEAGTPPAALLPALEPAMSDRKIQAIAFQGAARIVPLPTEEREQALAAWETQIRGKLPPLAAEEVIRTARQFLNLAL